MNLSAIASLIMLQTAPAMSSDTEACLRENAVAVEQASDTLTEAVDFLTAYLCATPVSRDVNVARNAAYAEMVTRLPRAGGIPVSIELPVEERDDDAAPDSHHGAPTNPEDVEVTHVGPFIQWEVSTLSPMMVPVSIRETASRLILDARLARIEREGSE